jgi:hypothetical protein
VISQNPGSPLAAHTSYTANAEGCLAVLQAAIGFAATGRSYFSTAESEQLRRALEMRELRCALRMAPRFQAILAGVSGSLLLLTAGWPERLIPLTASVPLLPDWITDWLPSAATHRLGRIGLCAITAIAGVGLYNVLAVTNLHNWWHTRAAGTLAKGEMVPRISAPGILFVLSLLPLASLSIWGMLIADETLWTVGGLLVTAGIVITSFMLLLAPPDEPPIRPASPLPAEYLDAFEPLGNGFERVMPGYHRGRSEAEAVEFARLQDAAITLVAAATSAAGPEIHRRSSALVFPPDFVVRVMARPVTPRRSHVTKDVADDPTFVVPQIVNFLDEPPRTDAVLFAICSSEDAVVKSLPDAEQWLFYLMPVRDALALRTRFYVPTVRLSIIAASGEAPVSLDELTDRIATLAGGDRREE